VLAVRRRTVPLAELRLRVPVGHADPATTMVLAPALLAGGPSPLLRAAGGELTAAADVDRLLVSGSCTADGLGAALTELGARLREGHYPADAVARERARVAELARMAGSEPGMVADEALNRRIYGDHPYGRPLAATDLPAVTAADLTRLHAERLGPAGATLVVVGDVDPDEVVALAEERLGNWPRRMAAPPLPAVGPLRPGPPEIVHRAGDRALIRIATEGAPPGHPDCVPLEVAANLLGGHCSSRLFTVLRERHGIAYTPRAALLHAEASSKLVVSVQVAVAAAGTAVRAVQHELDRLATEPVPVTELERARRHALGSRQLALRTQAGLADQLIRLAGHGLPPEGLIGREESLLRVTADDLLDAARRYLRPAVTVVVGDAAVLTPSSLI
jgi:predicted Zn-dependent peptidase